MYYDEAVKMLTELDRFEEGTTAERLSQQLGWSVHKTYGDLRTLVLSGHVTQQKTTFKRTDKPGDRTTLNQLLIRNVSDDPEARKRVLKENLATLRRCLTKEECNVLLMLCQDGLTIPEIAVVTGETLAQARNTCERVVQTATTILNSAVASDENDC